MMSPFLQAKMNAKNKIKDRILCSPMEGAWQPIDVTGSFYLTVYKHAEEYIDDDGDWDWLNNVITGEKLSAKEALIYGKR